MATSTQWQVVGDAAERYEQIVVPAILGPFARALVTQAAPPAGALVLDVGCGTGAAARAAAEHVGPSGRVIGVDVNPAMLRVARSLPPVAGAAIEWVEQTAYQLPVPDRMADVVLCAQVLQFLDQPALALAEMQRVLKPGGCVALSLWCEIEENPYFQALVESVSHAIGPNTAVGLSAAFRLSRPGDIRALLADSGLQRVELAVTQLELDLPPLPKFVPQHIAASPMEAGYTAAPPAAQQVVVQDMLARLAPYRTAGGARVPFKSHVVRGFR